MKKKIRHIPIHLTSNNWVNKLLTIIFIKLTISQHCEKYILDCAIFFGINIIVILNKTP